MTNKYTLNDIVGYACDPKKEHLKKMEDIKYALDASQVVATTAEILVFAIQYKDLPEGAIDEMSPLPLTRDVFEQSIGI